MQKNLKARKIRSWYPKGWESFGHGPGRRVVLEEGSEQSPPPSPRVTAWSKRLPVCGQTFRGSYLTAQGLFQSC